MNSNEMPIPLIVFCESNEQAESWRRRAGNFGLSECIPVFPATQAWERLREIISRYDTPVIVCQHHVWLGREFGDMARGLIADLERLSPEWAVCGNRGCLWDFSYSYDFTTFSKNEGAGLETAFAPKAVFSVDDNLLLLNCRKLRSVPLAGLSSVESAIAGLPLSLECLRHSLPMFVDPRLFCVRTEQHSVDEIKRFAASADFFAYYRQYFVNHIYPWPDSDIDLGSCVDYEYVANPKAQKSQFDLVELFERSLLKARPSPVLELCCRTQFRRMEMLKRTLSSFVIAELEARDLLKINIALVTDSPFDISEPAVRQLQEEFPSLPLECWRHTVRPPRASRTDLLLAAVERATGDYIWFVDDDDYVLPGAARALGRTLSPTEQAVVVGNSMRMEETWVDSQRGGEPLLLKNKVIAKHDNRNLLRIFSGANHVPICGMVLPLEKAKAALAGKRAVGDYNEDYFVLLSALTAPQADARTLDSDLAAVSVRGAENTVSRTDTSEWFHSYASFAQELLCSPTRNPMFWQLAKRLPGLLK